MPKPVKDNIGKLWADLSNDCLCKNLNNTLANRIQQHVKRFILHGKVRFIPGIQVQFNIWNKKLKSTSVIQHIVEWTKKTIIISIDAEKTFDKIQDLFLIKTLKELMIEENYLNIIESICKKPIAKIFYG